MADSVLNTAVPLSAYLNQRDLAEQALRQVPVQMMTTRVASNHLAGLIRHVGAHLESRWTDVLSSDLEKGREKAAEFADDDLRRSREQWERGWERLTQGLHALEGSCNETRLTLRRASITALEHLYRNYGHTCFHVGQIVCIAKLLLGERWIPLR